MNIMKGKFEKNAVIFDFSFEETTIPDGEVVLRKIENGYANGMMQYRTLSENENTVVKVEFKPLEGTEKQIDWAEDIRNKKVYEFLKNMNEKGFDNLLEAAKKIDSSIDTYQKVVDFAVKNNFKELMEETDAKKIIESR
nr:MAG TPA: hypothetical protein [Caudoviricetes sp.]